MGVVIQAIRDSARGEPCMLRTPYCNNNAETTVLCHYTGGGKGMQTKADDFHGAYGCSGCHDAMDTHRLGNVEPVYWLGGILRTQRRLYEKGIMQFPEAPKPPRVVNKSVKHPGVIRS